MARFTWDTEIKKWVEIDGFNNDPNAKLNGPIWCPEGGYYDMFLNKRFNSKSEKRQWMRGNGIMMDGNHKPVDKRGVGYFYNK